MLCLVNTLYLKRSGGPMSVLPLGVDHTQCSGLIQSNNNHLILQDCTK